MVEADLWLQFGTHAFGIEVLVTELRHDQIVFHAETSTQSAMHLDDFAAFVEMIKNRSAELVQTELRLFFSNADQKNLDIQTDLVTLQTPLSPWPMNPQPTNDKRSRDGSLSNMSSPAELVLFGLSGFKGASSTDEQNWAMICRRI